MAIVENIRIYIRNFILSPCVCVCVAKLLIALMQDMNYEHAPNEQALDIGKYIHVTNRLTLRALQLGFAQNCTCSIWFVFKTVFLYIKEKTGEQFLSVVALKTSRWSYTNQNSYQAHHKPVDDAKTISMRDGDTPSMSSKISICCQHVSHLSVINMVIKR